MSGVNMRLFYTFVFGLTVILIGLSLFYSKKEPPVNITVSSWTGYTPIFYAKEKGWLDSLNLKIHHVATLNESLQLYKTGLSDGFATTNDVAITLYQDGLEPILILDRSNGGDKIISNLSLQEIQNSHDIIDVFLEVNSVNQLLFNEFVAAFDLNISRFKLHNMSQDHIVTLKSREAPTLFVTYDPFANILLQGAYKELVSSKLPSINILDVLIVKRPLLHTHPKMFKKLQHQIYRAISQLKKNPQEFYNTVENYLEGQSFEMFMKSLEDVQLIHKETDQARYLKMLSTDIQRFSR
jgi:NitT/TauT family transport system substrate-binding protein